MNRRTICLLATVSLGSSIVIPAGDKRASAYGLFGGSCHFVLSALQENYSNQSGSGNSVWWTDNAIGGAGRWNTSTPSHHAPLFWQGTTSGASDTAIKTYYEVGGAFALVNENRSTQTGGITCADGNSRWTNATIWFNTAWGSTWPAFKRQANGVHEWGHTYGLKDLPQTGCGTKDGMMQGGAWAYDACGWFYPRPDDLTGINFYA